MITGHPRPLPECRRCQTPMRRRAWAESGGVCTSCLSLTEALQRVHTRHQLARVAEVADRRAQARIDALAARRADRAARAEMAIPS